MQRQTIKLTVLRKLKYILDRQSLERIYISYIRPSIEYANIVWHNCTVEQSERLERIQLECARIFTESVKGTRHKQLHSEIGWLTLAERRTHSQITKMYELVNHLAPSYLYLLVSLPNQQQYNLRNARNLPLIFGT